MFTPLENKRSFVLMLTVLSLFCASCTKHQTFLSEGILDEIRLEVADLRKTVNEGEIDLRLMEERIEANEHLIHASDVVTQEILSKKVAELEKKINANAVEIRSFIQFSKQIARAFEHNKEKLSLLDDQLAKMMQSKGKQATYPVSSEKQMTYRVKSGDNLHKIAHEYHVTIEALKRENQLTSDQIQVGQQLKIPAS